MLPNSLIVVPPFTQDDWYWIADDGRIFGSARRSEVETDDDAKFNEWVAVRGHGPTIWPRDLTGKQTNAALGQVLECYGLSVPGYEPKSSAKSGSSKTSSS